MGTTAAASAAHAGSARAQARAPVSTRAGIFLFIVITPSKLTIFFAALGGRFPYSISRIPFQKVPCCRDSLHFIVRNTVRKKKRKGIACFRQFPFSLNAVAFRGNRNTRL